MPQDNTIHIVFGNVIQWQLPAPPSGRIYVEADYVESDYVE